MGFLMNFTHVINRDPQLNFWRSNLEANTATKSSTRGAQKRQMRYPQAAHFIEYKSLLMVGAEGFEPPTLCSQSRCATRLRYAPIPVLIIASSAAKTHWRFRADARRFLCAPQVSSWPRHSLLDSR